MQSLRLFAINISWKPTFKRAATVPTESVIMTSYIEQIVEGLGNLAPIMVSGLAEVRLKDEVTRNLLKAINKEEGELLEELKQISKLGPDFDEEPFKARAQILIARRREASLILEDQNKFAVGIYQHLDQKIKDFDRMTKGIAHLFPDGGSSFDTDESRRKKKRKSSSNSKASSSTGSHSNQEEEDEFVSVFDPNEPKYCKCRRVSFGSMVACENPECAIEWFHFECVGLKTEPADPWFCASCREPPKELTPKPATPSVAWKDIYEKMKQDSSVAANPLEILDLPAPL